MMGPMRRAVLVVVLGLVGGCPKKAKPSVESQGSSTAPILQPVENKLDNSMQVNENRAKPDPE